MTTSLKVGIFLLNHSIPAFHSENPAFQVTFEYTIGFIVFVSILLHDIVLLY